MFCFRHFKDGNIYKKKYKNSEISNTSSPGRKVSRGRTTGQAQIYRRCPLLLERYEVQPIVSLQLWLDRVFTPSLPPIICVLPPRYFPFLHWEKVYILYSVTNGGALHDTGAERGEICQHGDSTSPAQSQARYWLIVLIVSNCCYCYYSVIV